jgi:hypothetical protein
VTSGLQVQERKAATMNYDTSPVLFALVP